MIFALYQNRAKKRGVVQWIRPEIWSHPQTKILLSQYRRISPSQCSCQDEIGGGN